jgi:23S rRNA pseudouridine1911/1915/1917 synthase
VPTRHAAAAENIAIDVLYEDDHLIAVDKPAGVAVHPAYKNTTGTLLNALLWRARGWPAPQRPSIAGRLDKLTSGVVLAAKTASAHAALQRAMAAKDARKQYLAVVYGRVNASWGEIRLPLSRDRADRRKMSVSRTGGAPSATGFERLAIAAAPRSGLSLLQCTLLTGRMHQIRAHLAFCGWPIVGDPVYGEPRWPAVTDQEVAEALRAFPRQALHAWRLSLTHPATGARLIVQAPVPPDLLRLLQVTGLSLPPPSIDLPTHH